MLLLLDSGHSRLAWGLANEHGWVAQGAVRNQDIGTLALREWQNLPRPARVIGVNVAGEATRVRVEAQLLRWRTMPDWLIATEYAAGVTNHYAMFSGVMQSICGAVEQMRARLATADSPTRCFLSGGAAPDIAPHLTAPVDVVDNLVLEGVLALATQT